MSPKAVTRASVVCLLALLAAGPAAAAITFTPSSVVVELGTTSVPVTALVTYPVGTTAPPVTNQLVFSGLPAGASTSPATVVVDNPSRATSVSVSFSIVIPPTTFGGTYSVQVSDQIGLAGVGSFGLTVPQIAVSPAAASGLTGAVVGPFTVYLSFSPNSPPTGEQQLVLSGLPAGATTNPATIRYTVPTRAFFATVSFSVVLSSSTAPGTSEVTVGNSPTIVGTDSFVLTVRQGGSLSMALEKASATACPGGAAVSNSAVVTPLDGYEGTATITFPALPADLRVDASSIPVPSMPPARTVPFSVRADAGAPPGPRTVNVLVTGNGGVTDLETFTVNVGAGDFTPVVSPSALTVNGGGAAGTVTASLAGGGCPPGSSITVTPSGLPPGVTVTPPSAVLGMPTFAPVTFSFQASASAAPGTSTVTFAFDPGPGGAPKAATLALTVCGPPGAPVSPVVRPKGSSTGPVTATDFLDLSWAAPASGFAPTRYEWRLNGGAWNGVTGTSAAAPPRGVVDPVQLFVRGFSCSPERGPGAEASSPTYALAPPTANFSFPTPVVAGRPVTFTDTSSPQATSWLWFPGDGMAATTVQSPTVTFPAAGPKVVVLVATNGSGSSTKAVTVSVQAASAGVPPPSTAFRAMGREADGRLALGRVDVEPGTTLLLRRLSGDGEAVAYLRLLDSEGRVVVERRLVLAEAEEARHDLSAWGALGAFRIEVVGPEGLEAVVEERAIPFGGPEDPVVPVRPGAALR